MNRNGRKRLGVIVATAVVGGALDAKLGDKGYLNKKGT